MAFGADTGRYLEMTILLRAVNGTGTTFSNVALAATAMAAAIGAGLAYSVKAAADFQTGLVTLATGAGEARNNLQMVGDGIKQISIDTATSTNDLLKGMFMIESGGYHAQDGLNILKVAAQGSKAENADLGKTAFALTGLLHDYGMKSTQAAEAMNGLIATESAGKMKMQDLTTSLGAVLPLASALHISFPEIGAAIAVMTNSNMTATRASQNLNFALRALEAPGNTAIDAMTAVGLSADQIIKTLSGPNGLSDALTLIEDHVGKTFPAGSAAFNTALKDIMGGATGWNVAVKLSGQHLQELEKDTRNITAAMSNASAGVKNWDLIQSTFNFKLGQMQQGLNVAAIDLGTLLLPQLEKVFAAVVPLIGQFTNWVETSQGLHTAIQNVGNFLAGVLVPALAAGAQWIGNFAQGLGNLIHDFQTGQADAAALEGSLTAIAIAVGTIKTAEMVAGWANWFNTIREGNGLIANLASKLLPELAQALGWQTVAEQESALQTEAAQATKAAAMARASAQIIQAQLDEAMATGIASGQEVTALYAAADAAATKAIRLRDYALMAEQTAAEEAVAMEEEAAAAAAFSTAMTLSFAAVTAGVSILVGVLVMALIQNRDTMAGMTKQTQDAYNSLGNSAQDAAMKQKAQSGDAIAQQEVQQQTIEDTAAKQKAAAVTSQVSWQTSTMNTKQNVTATSAAIQTTWATLTHQSQQQALDSASHWKESADASSGRWQVAGEQMAKNMANATSQMIISQQKVKDAAAQDAAAAADSWSNFVSQMHGMGIDPINGGKWDPSASSTPQHGRVRPPTLDNSDSQVGVSNPYAKAASNFIPGYSNAHASGIMNSPFGHFAMVGERGPELMYVPKGSNIYPNGTGPGGTTINVHVSTMAGSRAEVSRMVDLIERELGSRFRAQTPGFGFSGLV